MDLTEGKVSFDQMPTVVSELKQEISGLKTLVRTLIDAADAAPKDAWMNIDELRAYHPDHPARPTIWVGKKAILVHKDGKKLRFLRSEIVMLSYTCEKMSPRQKEYWRNRRKDQAGK